jgi:aspartate aminotransferase-like enzyme
VAKKIHSERPAVLFAPHVETSTGVFLPDHYIKKATEAMREVGGLFVLDCIASGTESRCRTYLDCISLGIHVCLFYAILVVSCIDT